MLTAPDPGDRQRLREGAADHVQASVARSDRELVIERSYYEISDPELGRSAQQRLSTERLNGSLESPASAPTTRPLCSTAVCLAIFLAARKNTAALSPNLETGRLGRVHRFTSNDERAPLRFDRYPPFLFDLPGKAKQTSPEYRDDAA